MTETIAADERKAVITGEEILVFAAGRNLPVPSSLVDLPVMKMDGEPLREKMVDAMRVLVTRDVSPTPLAAGVPEPPLAQMLAIMCDPEISMAVTLTRGSKLYRSDFAGRDGRTVMYHWNEADLYALTELSEADVVPALVRCAGLDGDDGSAASEPSGRVRVHIDGFWSTAAEGPDAVAELLRAALPEAQADAAAALADAMDASLPCRAVFARADGETIGLIWIDAGPSGLWAFNQEPDGSANFELLTGADIRAALADGLRFARSQQRQPTS